MARGKKKSKVRKFVIAGVGILVLSAIVVGFNFYLKIYAPNVKYDDEHQYLYVPTGTTYTQLLTILSAKNIVSKIEHFDWVAQQMNLPSHVYAGKYKLQPRMSNYELVKLLRSGKQEPVKLVINKFRLKEDLVSFVSHKLEADSTVLMLSLNDEAYLRKFNVIPQTVMALFIPNTYEFKWNTNPENFMKRMKSEYDRFWNEERKQKAETLKLTPVEVITLASIVEEETNYDAEKSRISGVYLNRIRKGMLLQADPTVKYALKNFTLTRVYNSHLSYSSPYNTYLNKGLPPGPICTPSINSVDAVLNAEQNDYLYFCASPDQPGTHVFAKTFDEHLLNARRYQKYLNGRGS